MKLRLFSITCILLLSCSQQKVKNLHLLNGYWEIEKVTFPSGESKTYKVNTVIDFIQIKNDSTGTRGKVMPRLDGTFISMEEYENFRIKKENGQFFMIYQNEESSRKEKLVKLTDNQFVVNNDQDKTYFYKRFEKFSVKKTVEEHKNVNPISPAQNDLLAGQDSKY